MKNGVYEERGIITCYKNDIIHSEDGPAIYMSNGHQEWLINGLNHREDGPAVEWPDGRKIWYIHGKKHREDGPACEWSETDKEWWIHGKKLTLQEFNQWLDKKNLHIKLEENLEPKPILKRTKI